MHCYNITLITNFQINIFNIEYLITNNHLGVGNRRLSPIYFLKLYIPPFFKKT